MSYMDSNHEVADTKLMLHAVDVTTSGDTSVEISSPDTDVFALCMLSGDVQSCVTMQYSSPGGAAPSEDIITFNSSLS